MQATRSQLAPQRFQQVATPVPHVGASSSGRGRGAAALAPQPLSARRRGVVVRGGLLKGPIDALADQVPDPVLRAAIKEPVAFWGGVFAGALRLNLDQEPLKSWVERTSKQAEVTPQKRPQPGSSSGSQ